MVAIDKIAVAVVHADPVGVAIVGQADLDSRIELDGGCQFAQVAMDGFRRLSLEGGVVVAVEEHGMGQQAPHGILPGAVHGVVGQFDARVANGIEVEVFFYMLQVDIFEIGVFQQVFLLQLVEFGQLTHGVFRNEGLHFGNLGGDHGASQVRLELEAVVIRRVVAGGNDDTQVGVELSHA